MKQRTCRALLVLLTVLSMSTLAVACEWDYDTLKMERSRFPDTLELITGKFLRHSPEFYQWRIQNRLERLKAEPGNPALMDDLAVAYDKTGQQDKAIETALKLETLHPGRYETVSNLGTFYFHAGRIAESIPPIERALKINPNAHFGREKYQKWLAEYVLERTKGGALKLPLAEVKVQPGVSIEAGPFIKIESDFYEYLCAKENTNRLTDEQLAPAIKGVSGMMRFANHKSPVLLEALGSLLTQPRHHVQQDAKMLAARAYLKASYEVSDEKGRQAYRHMAREALESQSTPVVLDQMSLDSVERSFKSELKEAESWHGKLKDRELASIRDGLDPEAEFDKLYDAEPAVSGLNGIDLPQTGMPIEILVILLVMASIFLTIVFVLVRWIRRTRATTIDSVKD